MIKQYNHFTRIGNKKRKIFHPPTPSRKRKIIELYSTSSVKKQKRLKKRFDPYAGICGEWIEYYDSGDDISTNDQNVIPSYII